MKPWPAIFIGGCFETGWALTMKLSDGFTIVPWTILTIIMIFCSTILLNYGFNRGIPIGSGYSVWVGIGAIGSIIMGIILFNEPLTALRMMFAVMILAGIIGVELCHKDLFEDTKETL